MWIELEDEIFSDIENIKDPYDKKIMAINTLFDSMWKCQHIVFASYACLNKISNHILISQTNQKFIKWIIEKYIYVYECSDIISYKIYVSSENIETYYCNLGYHISIYKCIDIRETKLLTENEADGIFFQRIFKYIAYEKKIISNYSIKYENDAFHGGNAPSKIQQTANEERIMLCIVDSDRDYIGAASGCTFVGANAKVKKLKKRHIIKLYELNAREKENLISPEMYLNIVENDLLNIINQEFKEENVLLFFDIKEGVTCKKKLYPDTGWSYHYNNLIKRCENIGICNIDAKEDTDVYINGIGGKICEYVSGIYFAIDKEETELYMEKASLNKQKKEIIIKEKNTILKNTPECIKREWYKLYELLFTWGCCLSEKKLPFYE